MRLVAAVATTVLLAAATGGAAQEVARVISAHDTGVPFMYVGTSTHGGGTLLVEHDFSAPVTVTESARVGGFVLYTAIDPSFEPPDAESDTLFFVDDGTTVNVEITGLDPQVAMKLGGVELDHVGASVFLGSAPTLHQHPEWQLTLPEGTTDCQAIGFRLTTDSPQYQASASYTAYVTNDVTTCPLPAATATPLPTATPLSATPTAAPTPRPGASCGDADESGSVTVSDGVNVLRAAAGLPSTCTPAVCDVDGSGAVGVSDGVNVLRAAAGLAAGLVCPTL
jgi:hypothetical protein